MNQETKTFLLAFAGALAALFAYSYFMQHMAKLSSSSVQSAATSAAAAAEALTSGGAANGFFS